MTVHDLLIPDAELSQLTTALANAGVVQPLDDIVAWAAQVVADYTIGYTLSTIRVQGFTRDLTIWRAYTLAGAVSENQQKAYDASMKQLEAIQAGKTQLPPATVATPPSSTGNWGSNTKICLR